MGGGGEDGARVEYDFLPVPVPVRLLNLTKIPFTVLVNVITLDGTYAIYQNSYFWDPTSSSSSSSLSIIYVIIISHLCLSPLTSSSPAFIIWLSAMSAMLRAPVKRGKILKYNRQDLENAVKAVETGDSIRQASAKYGILRSTIGDCISGRFDIKKPVVHGSPPAIPFATENKIVASVKMAAKMCVGLSRKQILTRTYILCKRIKMQTSYPNFKAGKDWWEGVKRRHPEITLRKPEKLSTVRARMLNPVVVENYFNDLERVISELGVSETEIWNCDETGLNFEHNPPRVVTERGANFIVGKTSQKSSNLTIMACVNGGGSVMPPLVITKGKTVK